MAGLDRFRRAVLTKRRVERVAGGDAQNPPESGIRGLRRQAFESLGGPQACLRCR